MSQRHHEKLIQHSNELARKLEKEELDDFRTLLKILPNKEEVRRL